MTIGITCACKDGVVVGADRKTIEGELKRFNTKISKLSFGENRGLLLMQAGNPTDASRAVREIDPAKLGLNDDSISLDNYLMAVGRPVSEFYHEYRGRLGFEPEFWFIVATIDSTGPTIGRIFNNGRTEMGSTYFTIGSARPTAEPILSEYDANMSLDDMERFVGYAIQKVTMIHNDCEGVNVFRIAKDKLYVETMEMAKYSALLLANLVMPEWTTYSYREFAEKIQPLEEDFRNRIQSRTTPASNGGE